MKRPKINEILKLIIRLIVLAGVIFLIYFLFFRKSKASELELDDTPLKVEQIRSIVELNTLKFQDEVVVDTVEFYKDATEAFAGIIGKLTDIDQMKNGFSNDGIKRRLTLIVRGTLLFGVDLKTNTFDIKSSNDTIYLKLPEPSLLSVELNPNSTEVYIENGFWKDSEVMALKEKARKKIINTANELKLVEKAKEPLEKLLSLLNASNKVLIIQYKKP